MSTTNPHTCTRHKETLTILAQVVVLLCGLWGGSAAAQITGTIRSASDGAPIAGVIITLRQPGETKILDYSRSDSEGIFRLERKPEGGLRLYFSLLGFRPDSLAVRPGVTDYSIALVEQATNLSEVYVEADPIRQSGDTITYLVSNYNEIQDRALADVLKKMPGIEVSKEGLIKYQGRSINKFYIEGRDLLNGQYGLATNTIHPEDVGAVEVIENHQPIAAIRDLSFSQDPAINIRLKESAKNRIAGTASLEGGATDDSPRGLWDGKTTMMRFAPDFQTLNTLRSTNTGSMAEHWATDFLSEAKSFTTNYHLSDPLAIRLPEVPHLSSERTAKGEQNLLSTHNLFGVGDHADLTTSITYDRSRHRYRSFAGTTYYLPDEARLIEEWDEMTGRDHTLQGEVALEINRNHLYLSDQLSGNLVRTRAEITTTGTLPHLEARRTKGINLENNLDLLIRRSQKLLTLHSLFRWERLPLSLLRTTRPEAEELSQQVSQSLLFTHTSTAFGYALPKGWLLSMEAGLSTMGRSLNAEATGLPSPLTPSAQDLRAGFFCVYAKPELTYAHRRLKGRLSLPLSCISYHYRGEEKQSLDRLPLSPRLVVDLRATDRLTLTLNGSYAQGMESDAGMWMGYIAQDYRTILRGSSGLGKHRGGGVSLAANYRNPIDALFAMGSVGLNRSRSDLLAGRRFEGPYMMTGQVSLPHTETLYSAYGRLSKGLTWKQTILTLHGNLFCGDQHLLLEGEETDYRFSQWTLTGEVHIRPARWVTAHYEVTYGRRGEAPSGECFTKRDHLYQQMSVVLKPLKCWRATLTGVHFYNQLTMSKGKHYLLSDAEIVYSSPKGWEVSLSGRNLFDNHTYSYSALSTLTHRSVRYDIRPLEVTIGVFFPF